jgi:hypothetical protein
MTAQNRQRYAYARGESNKATSHAVVVEYERASTPLHSITSSARERRRGDAERLHGLEVDHQLALRRLLDGQVRPH